MKKIHVQISRHKWETLLALLPVAAAGVYRYGTEALIIVTIAVVSAQGFEWIVALLRKQLLEIRGGALITGGLVGLILPPSAPLWAPVFGAVVGLALGKMAFGGRFKNIFNPAIVGIVALVALFPGLFTGYGLGLDAVSGASPVRMVLQMSPSLQEQLITLGTEQVGASIGESSGGALLLGGFFLIIRRAIDWHVPAVLFATVGLLSFLYGSDPLLQISSGGLFLCAFFMATDIAISPHTQLGKVI
ncbi:MAG: RnfABCDGE type electron transport complex subunit D, partial [Nitrospiria bacterium]